MADFKDTSNTVYVVEYEGTYAKAKQFKWTSNVCSAKHYVDLNDAIDRAYREGGRLKQKQVDASDIQVGEERLFPIIELIVKPCNIFPYTCGGTRIDF